VNVLFHSLPPKSIYRKNVEAISKYRLKVVEENEDREVIESQIQAGIIEMLIIHAKTELKLIKRMAEEKAWEAPHKQHLIIWDQNVKAHEVELKDIPDIGVQ